MAVSEQLRYWTYQKLSDGEAENFSCGLSMSESLQTSGRSIAIVTEREFQCKYMEHLATRYEKQREFCREAEALEEVANFAGRRLVPRSLMSRYDPEQGKHVPTDPYSPENEIPDLSEP